MLFVDDFIEGRTFSLLLDILIFRLLKFLLEIYRLLSNLEKEGLRLYHEHVYGDAISQRFIQILNCHARSVK